jgi:hypothetical protein
MSNATTPPEGYDPTSTVARFFGVHVKTIGRWKRRPGLDFPRPVRINDRDYFERREYHNFARRAAVAHAAKSTTT